MNYLKAKDPKTLLFAGAIILGVIGLLVWNSVKSGDLKSARELYQQGDTTGAAAEFKAQLEAGGGTPRDWNNYGNVLRDLKDYAGASTAYQKAIQADPRLLNAYRNLSYVHLDWEQTAEGENKIHEAIEIIETGFNKTGKKEITLAEDLIMLYTEQGNEAKASEWRAVREDLLK